MATKSVTERAIESLLVRLLARWTRSRKGDDVSLSTYSDAGMLDRHAKGVVLNIGDAEFQISVIRSR